MKQKRFLAMALAAVTVFGAAGETVVPVAAANGSLNVSKLEATYTGGEKGKEMSFTVNVTPASNSYEYSFAISPADSESAAMQDNADAYANSEYQTSPEFKWTPVLTGNYVLTYNVLDTRTNNYAWDEMSFAVTEGGTVITGDKTVITSAEGITATTGRIRWQAVEGATDYLIYYSEGNVNGTYTFAKTVKNATETNVNVKPDVTYYFKVLPRGTGTYEYSDPASIKTDIWTGITVPSQPTVTRAYRVSNLDPNNTQKTICMNKVEWTAPTSGNVDDYVIYRTNGTTTEIAGFVSNNARSFTTGCATQNTVWTYFVRARVYGYGGRTAGKYQMSPNSNKVTVEYPLTTVPEITSITKLSSNQATVSWQAVAGADGYRVLRSSTGKDGSYVLAATVSGNVTSAAVAANTSGTTYYTVQALKIDGNARVWTDPAAVQTYVAK